MSKQFLTVADDFEGTINLAGHPKAYRAGDLIVLDDDSAEERAIRDLGVDGTLTNTAKRDAALAALSEDGVLVASSNLSAPDSGERRVWTTQVALAEVANNDVLGRIKPGFSGRVLGFSALSLADATTASKAASLSLAIVPGVAAGSGDTPNASDAIVLLTVSGSPAGGTWDADIDYDGPEGEISDSITGIARNATVGAVQTAIDATDLAGLITVGGSAGAWTLTAADASLDVDLTNSFTGGTSPTITATDTTVGGGNRIVGASGNPATLDLTSSNVSDGGVVAGETIATGSNPNHGNFTENDEILLIASGVTAFVEGSVLVSVYLADV